MNYLSQILFFFGAIGAFNSLILALFLLLRKRYSKLQNKLFALYLLVISIRIIHSLFYAFSSDDSIWSVQLGPAYFLLIAPLLFTYVLSFTKPLSFLVKRWKSHVLFWIIIVTVITVLLPFKKNVLLIKETILPIIYVQWFIYILASFYSVQKNIRTKKKRSVKLKWVVLLLAINLIIWASFSIVDFDYFITGSLLFSFFFYSFYVFLLLNKETLFKIFETNKIKKNITISTKNKNIINQLDFLITSEKLYKNSHLKIVDIAKETELSPHELSKLINDSLGVNFTDFINKYRIEEAKKLLNKNSIYTIEAIGNIADFNSKSAFYKAFRKITNTTPAKFKSK